MKSIVDYTNKLKEYFASKQALANKYIMVEQGYGISATADGTKTTQTLLKEVFDEFVAYLNANHSNYMRPISLRIGSDYYIENGAHGYLYTYQAVPASIYFNRVNLSAAHFDVSMLFVSSTLANNICRTSRDAGTPSDFASDVPTTGTKIIMYFDVYEKL